MAGPFRGRSGTAGHDSDRNSNERNAASYLSAIRVHFWPVLRDHDLRRQFRERLEPAEGPGKAYAGHSAARTPASNRLGLRSEEQTPELQSLTNVVCRLLLGT